MTRKTLLPLVVGIVLFLTIYLYYIKIERSKSIERYFDDPRIGDIYKMRKDDADGVNWLFYLKVVSRHDDGLTFIPSKLKSDASADHLLKQYDNDAQMVYTYKELHEIRTGKWNNYQHENTTLVEIIRK